MTSKLIVALDFDNERQALNLIDSIDPATCGLKVGSELFTRFGAQFVRQLVSRTFNVFLDLKFHDIPNTVAHACKAAADLGVWMMNVHALGGINMMKAANEALKGLGKDRPILIAVTVLTSHTEHELSDIGITNPLTNEVTMLARLAQEAGLDGVVSSAHEVRTIKHECGDDFITVTPGIRLTADSNDDQSRIMTPKQAITEGTNFLVIGRPITQSARPSEVIATILTDIS
ncbi:orotidine-5'-phosphate decarboxylase [Legionella bononiensis]|uniref:Orotidine 5'-phosphate decarboxylase n=1 Tax=Legionella bononiensis TaxID=2793102 RepID=A0ABS1W7L6_9GAMM|nr:orotidine-5'-phosphate decarboxylase [Legionella bononiensis]MBL7480134.1 orotidine-5'-phosphate decarboxylase [Legionella bononiensis]MBL7525351.1 orotidine-5'-phosphate decarboxylase [Legionella bononiensis]MBL7561535.1 orotidine-5'-phosphate decarboxylase [Legionella bononiensis]